MNKALEGFSLLLVLVVCAGFTIGLTYAPCYSSLCSEDFFPLPTRLHCASFFGLLASIGSVLLLRAYSPLCRSISNYHLTKNRLPILGKRISAGGLALAIWLIGINAASSGFWVSPEYDFWGLRTNPLHWKDAQIRLTVTGVTGHHADILLGLVLIPVSRNSILGRAFQLHQSTLLFAHKLIAYLFFIAVLAHGAATYTFVATYAAAKDDSPKKNVFNVDNPTLTINQTEKRGNYHSATLGTGMISFLLMVVIVVTSLPVLRRRAYNTFYYAHIICSVLIFIGASIHASTDFYFLLPGLLLWVFDWGWRMIRGDSGIRKKVECKFEDAGFGWYRITLPVAAKSLVPSNPSRVGSGLEDGVRCDELSNHPLQTYYLNIPSISKLENHAFTAAKIGSTDSGPVLLFQRTLRLGKKRDPKLEKEWTWKLGQVISSAAEHESVRLDVRVEGPYIPTETGFQTADRVVCLVGGTGLTGACSLAHWWLKHRGQDSSALFTLIWTKRRDAAAAPLREFSELHDLTAFKRTNFRLGLHTTSKNDRMDVSECLRGNLVRTDEKLEARAGNAWVYVSGPSGLLDTAEDACIDIKRELKRARKEKEDTGLAVTNLEYYIARWEV